MGAAGPIGEFGSGQAQLDGLWRGELSRLVRRYTRSPPSRRKIAFTDGADIRAANSDIGERVVVKGH